MKGVAVSSAGIIGVPVFDMVGSDLSCQGPDINGLRTWDEDDGVKSVRMDESVEVCHGHGNFQDDFL